MSDLTLHSYNICAENEIDGSAFLDLTEADVKELIKPLGTVKRIIRLKQVCVYINTRLIFSWNKITTLNFVVILALW